MKLLVHCGQPKTGSSSLQATLGAHRAALRRHGICYPAGLFGPEHGGIAPLFLDESHCFTICTHDGVRRRTPDEIRERGRAEWASILNEATEQRPDVLILSHESYCHLDSDAEARRMRSLLSEISEDVSLCVYVRNPAERYHSATRQAIKTRGVFAPPRPLRIRGFLTAVTREFGVRANVRVYARSALVKGDIVTDFLATQLNGPLDPSMIEPCPQNDSLSTEAASILLHYRRAAFPETLGFLEPRAARVRHSLEILDRSIPRSRPETLLEPVRRAIVRSSVELDWLKDEYGVVLPGIDYPVDDGSALPDLQTYTRLEEVCVVDHARREELLSLLIGRLGTDARAERSLWARMRTKLLAPMKRVFRTPIRRS